MFFFSTYISTTAIIININNFK